MAHKSYQIFVTDANGWDEGCPDYESVFFSPNPDEQYIHPVDGGHRNAGSLIVRGYRAAHERLNELRQSGDWQADTGEIERPSYAMTEWRSK